MNPAAQLLAGSLSAFVLFTLIYACGASPTKIVESAEHPLTDAEKIEIAVYGDKLAACKALGRAAKDAGRSDALDVYMACEKEAGL